MSDLAALIAADAEQLANTIPSDDVLHTIGSLAARMVDLDAQIKAAQEAMDLLQDERDNIAERQLPDALAQTGLSEFRLADGSKVDVGDEYYPNIPSADTDKPELLERRMACFRWFRENNHADLIKQEVRLAFGKGNDKEAQRVVNGLDKAGIPYTRSEQVHPSTLKAFVREQVENGKPFPMDTFGVCHKRVAKVKPARKGQR